MGLSSAVKTVFLTALLFKYNTTILRLLIHVTLLTDYNKTSHMLAIWLGTHGGAVG